MLTIKDLWLDANQGLDASDRKFGYIGTDEEYEDEDGDSVEYCGWFFTWGGDATTEEGREAIIESLETDETMRHNDEIPHEMVVEKLTAYLDKKYPLAKE